MPPSFNRIPTSRWAALACSHVRSESRDRNEPQFQAPADEVSLGKDGDIGCAWTGDTTLCLMKRPHRATTVFSRGSEATTSRFATTGIGATYRPDRQSVRIALRNLTDKAYHEHLAKGLPEQEIRAPGRSLMVSWQGAS